MVGSYRVTNCIAVFGESGFRLGDDVVVKDSLARGNATGFELTGIGATLTECTADRNTVIGIHINAGTNNLVVGNTASNNATNYTLAGANSFGPIVNVAGVGDISGTVNANHPWVNFEH